LTPVPVHSHDVALLVLQTCAVLDLLLDASAEETLRNNRRNHEELTHILFTLPILVLISNITIFNASY